MVVFQKVFSVKSKIKNYSVLKTNSIHKLNLFLRDFDLIIADINVKSHLSNEFDEVHFFDCSEKLKTWENLNVILNLFVKKNLNKKSKVIIVGGGTLQDAVSFCCSIFNRGIPFTFVPTTLLSMCDSCIGGKTSINYSGFKNKLGNFYPPDQIIICKNFITTLKKNEFLSGLGEIFKFQTLQNKTLDIDYTSSNSISTNLIIDSLKFKVKIIEKDEFDNNERIKLNYGHTFGHALEVTSNYQIPHGLAVVIGINIANYISYKMKLIDQKKYTQIKVKSEKLISNLDLECDWFDIRKLLPIIKKDKKNISGIRMILLSDKGSLLRIIKPDDLIMFFNEFVEKEL